MSAFGIVAIATINAVGGAAVADILLDRPPFILFEDFYASCAILGGTACWVATMFGEASTAAVVWALVTVVTWLAAVLFDRELPKVQAL